MLLVAVANSFSQLPKQRLGYVFFEGAPLAHVAKEITTKRELHHKKNVLLRLKVLIKTDNVAVVRLAEDRDLLHHFLQLTGIAAIKVALIDRLDCDELASQLVLRQIYLSEGASAYNLAQKVVVHA